MPRQLYDRAGFTEPTAHGDRVIADAQLGQLVREAVKRVVDDSMLFAARAFDADRIMARSAESCRQAAGLTAGLTAQRQLELPLRDRVHDAQFLAVGGDPGTGLIAPVPCGCGLDHEDDPAPGCSDECRRDGGCRWCY